MTHFGGFAINVPLKHHKSRWITTILTPSRWYLYNPPHTRDIHRNLSNQKFGATMIPTKRMAPQPKDVVPYLRTNSASNQLKSTGFPTRWITVVRWIFVVSQKRQQTPQVTPQHASKLQPANLQMIQVQSAFFCNVIRPKKETCLEYLLTSNHETNRELFEDHQHVWREVNIS